MGDKATLSKARQELEELYLGVPDESVDLTFKDFVSTQQNGVAERKKTAMDPIHEHESAMASKGTLTLGKLPSLDLARGLQPSRGHNHIVARDDHNCGRLSPVSNRRMRGMSCSTYESSRAYDDDLSVISGVSNIRDPYDIGRVRRKRPGIPHSNICTICSLYIYFFQHRCLVCGRVYCRDCVNVGMGEMTEGRKCLECLGKRFSVRYIHRAGNVGCCMSYPSRVKQQELRWAEKGPRSGEKRYGTSRYTSRTRSPELPRTPRSAPSPVSFNMSAILQSPVHPHIPV